MFVALDEQGQGTTKVIGFILLGIWMYVAMKYSIQPYHINSCRAISHKTVNIMVALQEKTGINQSF